MAACTNWFDHVVRGAPGQSPSGPIVRAEKLPYGLGIVTEIYGVITVAQGAEMLILIANVFPFTAAPHTASRSWSSSGV